ncbi:glutaredoxin 3 [Rhodoblastus acidophilus]|uniref:glutaredoxin n=1 Tax=Rhodoblastus acidophilus TaxID=1074 RepID=UPI00222588CB|nr:glutaredoxin [Rhodoblastus acidophilus]MCW2286644.1 glutaredoxin 3 [Rhodoblastus acidophilus]MCW2335580.1 glutaredoxin 3 [Rhodoblastus acidophilus]
MATMDKWVILGKASCKWCDKAIALLEGEGVEYSYLSIEANPQLRNFMIANGLTTVPQVYKNGQLIGGYAEVEARFTGDPLFTSKEQIVTTN